VAVVRELMVRVSAQRYEVVGIERGMTWIGFLLYGCVHDIRIRGGNVEGWEFGSRPDVVKWRGGELCYAYTLDC
jgi:hypothetical protein